MVVIWSVIIDQFFRSVIWLFLVVYIYIYIYIYIYVLLFLNYWKLVKIGCKIESVVRVNFKKLLAKIVNLIFKYILSS